MTSKEKAKELVDKFTVVGLQQRNEGYQCALIAVDEILDEIQPFELAWEYAAKIQFWNNVKQEIENLLWN
jgi:hypothetical protein